MKTIILQQDQLDALSNMKKIHARIKSNCNSKDDTIDSIFSASKNTSKLQSKKVSKFGCTQSKLREYYFISNNCLYYVNKVEDFKYNDSFNHYFLYKKLLFIKFLIDIHYII